MEPNTDRYWIIVSESGVDAARATTSREVLRRIDQFNFEVSTVLEIEARANGSLACRDVTDGYRWLAVDYLADGIPDQGEWSHAAWEFIGEDNMREYLRVQREAAIGVMRVGAGGWGGSAS